MCVPDESLGIRATGNYIADNEPLSEETRPSRPLDATAAHGRMAREAMSSGVCLPSPMAVNSSKLDSGSQGLHLLKRGGCLEKQLWRWWWTHLRSRHGVTSG